MARTIPRPRLGPIGARSIARLRRLVARRPWIQWCLVVALAAVVAAAARHEVAATERARAAWGATTVVWVAEHDVAVGETVVAERRDVPTAVVPPAAVVEAPVGAVARQAIGEREIVTAADVARAGDELALAPEGWLVAPVEERPPSGAGPGERVRVVSGGFVIAPDAVVVGSVDGATLVAVPGDLAPLLPAAAEAGPVTLLRVP